MEKIPERSEETKREVPQLIEQTGISADFRNEYAALMTGLEMGGVEYVRSLVRDLGALKRYEEHFPPSQYRNAVHEKNRDRVEEIDAVIDSLNEKLFEPDMTEEALTSLFLELEELILGKQ